MVLPNWDSYPPSMVFQILSITALRALEPLTNLATQGPLCTSLVFSIDLYLRRLFINKQYFINKSGWGAIALILLVIPLSLKQCRRKKKNFEEIDLNFQSSSYKYVPKFIEYNIFIESNDLTLLPYSGQIRVFDGPFQRPQHYYIILIGVTVH